MAELLEAMDFAEEIFIKAAVLSLFGREVIAEIRMSLANSRNYIFGVKL